MTLHHTDFVSSLFAERGRIRAAQGLLSRRLVKLDELLAEYGRPTAPEVTTPEPSISASLGAETGPALTTPIPGEDSIIAHAQELPAAPLPGEVAAAGATSAGEVDLPPSASPATIPEPPVSHPADPPRSEASTRKDEVLVAPEAPSDIANTISLETPTPSQGSEAAVDDADAAPAGEVASPVASPAPPPHPISTRQRVKQLHHEHPEYTRREAWEALGITEGSLAGHSYALGIKWKLLEPVKFERPAPPAPPEDAIAPDETVPDIVQQRPRAHVAKGAQFRLRAGRGDGKYLHMSGIGMTDNKNYAWIGTEAQLLKLRQKFPDARDLVEEVVEKEPAR